MRYSELLDGEKFWLTHFGAIQSGPYVKRSGVLSVDTVGMCYFFGGESAVKLTVPRVDQPNATINTHL